MRLTVLPLILAVTAVVALPGSSSSLAAEQPLDIPDWLQPYVGTGEGQIAPVVLQRARALYRRKVSEGAVRDGCCFVMDAARPSTAA